MKRFEPNYKNIENAARNIEAERLPLYEHIICEEIMEQFLHKPLGTLTGSYSEKIEYFRNYCAFFKNAGYDTVSFECCIGPAMPGSGSLGSHVDPVIKTKEDFEKYPWAEIPDRFFQMYGDCFKALGEVMPAGMKAIGGPGNGIFECVQDVVSYMELCYISADDPDFYAALFQKVGETNLEIWKRFLKEYGDTYCVMRFGDDLGYKNNTMLPAEDIRRLIIPQYKKIIGEVHRWHKPFLLHSCGYIFDVMEDLIAAGIDAKHSNEDQIAMFDEWVMHYGDRIGNFGGIDTDAVCRLDKQALREYITEMIAKCTGHGGFAFASGNSIPNYVPYENYMNMVEIVREIRGA